MNKTCCAIIELSVCGAPAKAVVLPTPAGRSPAVGGPYCAAHGGVERARAEAERDWNYQAPASVGDDEAVLDAGCESLRSPDSVIVVRPEHGRWLAWYGIGSMLKQVANPHAVIRTRGRRGGRGKPRSSGRYAFPSQEAALEIALQVWRKRLDAHVKEICTLRGGTLSWGLPVAPLAKPAIYVLGEHGSAWDANPTYAAVAR